MHRVGATLLLASALCVSVVCCAEVGTLSRFSRPSRRLTSHLQRQQLNPTPYPAAGFRPERQFPLPDTASSQEAQAESNDVSRPELTYGAPARLRQFPAAAVRQQQQLAPQQVYAAPQLTYGTPVELEAEAQATASAQPARLTAPKSARLTADREDREDRDEDIDEQSVDAEVDEVKSVAPKAVAPQATIAYFPAGAVSFVQPVAAPAAKFIAKLPAQTAAYALAPAAPAAYTQPQIYATSPYFQPQFAYAAAPAQLNAW